MPDPLILALVERHPDAAARFVEPHEHSLVLGLLQDLPPAHAAKLLAKLTASVATACLQELPDSVASAALETLPIATAITLLARVDRRHRARLLSAQPAPRRASMQLVLRYPAGTVGAMMDPAATTARASMRVSDATKLAQAAPDYLRRYIYVLDDANRLKGTLDVRQCLLLPASERLSVVAKPAPVALRARASLNDAAGNPAWNRLDILPVVGPDDAFLGVIRRNTLERAVRRSKRRETVHPSSTLIELGEFYWGALAELLTGPPRPDATPAKPESKS